MPEELETKAVVLNEPEINPEIIIDNVETPKLQPHDIEVFAQYAIESGLFKDVKTKAQAYIKVWAGQELGLPPAYSMRSLYWIETKDGHSHIGMTANVIATLIKKSNRYDYRVKEMTDTRCSIIFYERGKELGSYTYTTHDAKRANLLDKPTWIGYTRDMLWNRAMSLGANKFTPDVKLGYLTVEEIQNLDSLEIDNPPAPVDSKTSGTPIENNPLVDAAKQAGAVELPNISKTYPKLLTQYPELSLGNCWEHGDLWVDGEYGKYHRMPKGSCYLRNKIRDMTMELIPKHLSFNSHEEPKKRGDKMVRYLTDEFKGWLEKDREIDDWNKTDIEKQLEVLESLISE